MNIKNKSRLADAIKANGIYEEEAKAAEAKEAAIEEALKDVKPLGLLDMLKAVKENKLLPITDEDGDIIGINCPEVVTGLGAVEKCGPHTIMGKDEAEKEKDRIALLKFSKEYGWKALRYFPICLELIEAKITPDDVVEAEYGEIYLILAKARKVMDTDGNIIVDLTDKIKDATKIDKELIIEMLKDKLKIKMNEIAESRRQAEEEYNNDDEEDYDEDEEEDEEDEEEDY